MTEPLDPRDQPQASPPAREIHEPPPGAGFMNALRWALFVGLLALAAVTIGRAMLGRRTTAVTESAKAVYYCPMHPSYTSDRPGECPICGMSLEPIPRTGKPAEAARGDVPGLTSVQLTPERIQLIGVRTALVERGTQSGSMELVGFVAPDESRFHRIQVRVPGWVQGLFVERTGDRLRVGQPLLAIYSPELFQTEQEYLIERRAGAGDVMHTMPAGGADSAHVGSPSGRHEATAGQARERLRLLGVPEEEIRRLEVEGTATTRLVLRSPAAGTVMEKNVVDGQYVGPETPLFTVADLSRVWVLADLYEMDLGRLSLGSSATFVTAGQPAYAFQGRVEFVYPTVSTETRTLKVRVTLANPRGLLRPGMFGTLTVRGRGAPALTVPAEAVVNTGEHDYVFVAHAGGRFEPRRVKTGARDDERVQIVSGVAAGDTVVASASFLIDSESRLKAAIEGMGAQPSAEHTHGGPR